MPKPVSKTHDAALRAGIVATCREMNRIGLNQGTSGNLSHRIPDGLLITPTSLPYERMRPADIVAMATRRNHTADGTLLMPAEYLVVTGRKRAQRPPVTS